MFKFLLLVYWVCCAAFVVSAGNPPFFPTDVDLNEKGEIVIAEKGTKQIGKAHV